MQLFDKSTSNLLSHFSASIVFHLFSSLQNYRNDNQNFPFVFDGKTWNNTLKIAYAYDSNVSLCPESIIFRGSLLVKSMLVSLLPLTKFLLTVLPEFHCRKKRSTWEGKYKEGWGKKKNLICKDKGRTKFFTLSYTI